MLDDGLPPGKDDSSPGTDGSSPGKDESASIPPSESKAEQFGKIIRQAAPYLAATWTMIAAVALGAFGGHWLDGRCGTRPWLAVTGTLLGTTVGMYELARVGLKRSGRN